MKRYTAFILTLLLLSTVAFAQQAFPPRTQKLQDAQSTGNGVELNTTGYSVVTLEIVGSEAGTDRVVTFEAWQDVTAGYVAVQCANQGTRVVSTTLTTSGVTAYHVQCDVAGFNRFRTPLSGGATGNVTVTATAISNSSAGIVAAVITPAAGAAPTDVNVEQWNNTTVTGGAGVVAAGTPRMTLASDDPAVTALQVIDDWDESDRAKVNIVVGQAGITAGAGVVAANTPRTTLASDDPAVVALQIIDDWDETNRAAVNTIAGQVGVQGGSGVVTALTQRTVLATDVALPTGTNSIGQVTANAGTNLNTSTLALEATLASIKDTAGIKKITDALPAGNNNIGDVDVLSVIPGTGATNLGKAEDTGHTTGDVGVMGLAVRNDVRGTLTGLDLEYAPLQLNSSGDVRVDGSAVTQPVSGPLTDTQLRATAVPVSGTVTANQGTANATPWNENVAQINGATPLMGNGVTGIGSQRVTIASDNTAFTVNVGTFPDNEPVNSKAYSGSVAGADGLTNTATVPLNVADAAVYNYVYSWLFNGTTWDRIRSGSATSTQPHYGATLVHRAGGVFTFLSSTTHAATTVLAAQANLGGFNNLTVTWDVTAAERDSANETYNLYITCGDGVSTWDVVHFPQIITTGAKRYTAVVNGTLLPQEVTTATPGVSANASGTFKTDTVGADEGTRTLAAGKVRHGMLGDRCGADIVIAGTIVTGITHSITMTVRP